jgi:hypothetical protein
MGVHNGQEKTEEVKNPFRKVVIEEIRLCEACGNRESRIYRTTPFLLHFKQGLFTITCILVVPMLVGMIVFVTLEAVYVWCFRSLVQRRNLIPELKKRVLSNGKLW